MNCDLLVFIESCRFLFQLNLFTQKDDSSSALVNDLSIKILEYHKCDFMTSSRTAQNVNILAMYSFLISFLNNSKQIS